MPKATPRLESFNAGEWSAFMAGRAGLAKYPNACKVLFNCAPMVEGPGRKRSGTRWVASGKEPFRQIRLEPFEFNVEQTYAVELGHLYARFFSNRQPLVDGGGTLVEIVTPYAESHLRDLQFEQSLDVKYIVHDVYPPAELERSGAFSWAVNVLEFIDGPYLDINRTDTEFDISGLTGNVILTASSTTGINNDQGFLSTDVGRLFRIRPVGSDWTWLEITAINSPTTADATIKGADLATQTTTKEWRLGAFSETTGYPVTVTFHDDRLSFAGVPGDPGVVYMSRNGDYLNMSPTEPDGTVLDDSAITLRLSGGVNQIFWIASEEKALLVGTAGGEYVITPSALNEALSPNNRKANRPSQRGSARVKAIEVGAGNFFVGRGGGVVRQMRYTFESDGYQAPHMSRVAPQVVQPGFVAWDYQQEPDSIIWGVRSDGLLGALTYEADEAVSGWHRHQIGGVSDNVGSPAMVESVAVVPSQVPGLDEVWLSVKRWIDGAEVRHIEFMEAPWNGTLEPADCYFMDGGGTYRGAPVSTITGVDHLEGETVQVLADGNHLEDKLVVNGSFELDDEYSVVSYGLPYEAILAPLTLEAGAADGTAQTRTQSFSHIGMRLFQSLGVEIGQDLDNMDELEWRDVGDDPDLPPPLFTGDKVVPWPGGHERSPTMYFRSRVPFPMVIVLLAPRGDTRGD